MVLIMEMICQKKANFAVSCVNWQQVSKRFKKSIIGRLNLLEVKI